MEYSCENCNGIGYYYKEDLNDKFPQKHWRKFRKIQCEICNGTGIDLQEDGTISQIDIEDDQSCIGEK